MVFGKKNTLSLHEEPPPPEKVIRLMRWRRREQVYQLVDEERGVICAYVGRNQSGNYMESGMDLGWVFVGARPVEYVSAEFAMMAVSQRFRDQGALIVGVDVGEGSDRVVV